MFRSERIAETECPRSMGLNSSTQQNNLQGK